MTTRFSYSAPGLERLDRSYPSVVLRLSAMDRVKFHLKFRRKFGLERDCSQRLLQGKLHRQASDRAASRPPARTGCDSANLVSTLPRHTTTVNCRYRATYPSCAR